MPKGGINQRKFKKGFKSLMESTRPLSDPKHMEQILPPGQHRMHIQDGYGFIILSDGVSFYSSITKEFLSVPFFQQHSSEAHLKSELNRLIVEYVNEPDQSQKNRLLNRFEEEVKSKVKKWIIIFPVEGVKLVGVKSVKIGNCVLRKYSNYQANRLSHETSNFKINVKKDIEPRVKIDGRKRIVDISLSDVNAHVEVMAPEQEKIGIGLLRLEEYLNILRFYIPILETFPANIYLGLERSHSSTWGAFYAEEVETQNPWITKQVVRPFASFELNKKRIQKLKQEKLSVINDIFRKEVYTLNQFERRIRAAINCFGRGISALNPVDQFLNYMISIESLIGVKEEGLQEHLSTVMSKLFVISGIPLNDKMKAYADFKQLYAVRSNIVHSGSDYVYDGFVNSARLLSRKLIFHMIQQRNKIDNDDQLFDYLTRLKLR